MKKKLKPRLGGRGKYGALQNFLSASYKRREDFSILKKFAYQTSNPTISRLAQIKLRQIALTRWQNDICR